MNSKKDNEDQDDKNSNDNNAKKNDKSTENSDDSSFIDISNNDGKGDKGDNSRFTDYSSTRSPPPKGKSTSSPPSKDSNDFKQKINNERKGITKKINRYKAGSINKKIIFSAIGIIAVAVVIMILSQGSNFKFNQEAVTEAKDLEISLKNVSITNIDNNNIKVNPIFNVYNPNQGTLILENIHYNVNLQNTRIASGDIGQRPEGFVDSSAGIYPIIGNGTVTLKDEKTIQKDNRIENVWNKITDETSSFQVNGSFAYRQTSSFQAFGGEIDFDLTYP
ncbi:MAG TPA: hypothetical protein VE595_05520 [Nitrososphaeraceae archaeon]|nr:hypothetical protein [Nitrososphaeraceae archaeon]